MPHPRIERLDTAKVARIMSVALEEFTQHRYAEASFNSIIRRSSMAKGTMYYYFSSKEDLFLTLYKATIREFQKLIPLANARVDDALQYQNQSLLIFRSIESILALKPHLGTFVVNFLVGGERQDQHPARTTALAVDAWLQRWLSKGQELGVIRHDIESGQLAALCWGVWQAIHPPRQLNTPIRASLTLDILYRLLNSPDTDAWRPVAYPSSSAEL